MEKKSGHDFFFFIQTDRKTRQSEMDVTMHDAPQMPHDAGTRAGSAETEVGPAGDESGTDGIRFVDRQALLAEVGPEEQGIEYEYRYLSNGKFIRVRVCDE